MRIISVVLCGAVLASVLGGCVTVQQQRNDAISAYQVGDYERSEALFNSVLLRKPIDAASYYYLGAIAHAKKQYVRAMQMYEQSLRARPAYQPALIGMEQVKADLGIEMYERLRTNPNLYSDSVVEE